MRPSIRSIATCFALAALLVGANVATAAFAMEPRITATSRAEPSHELTPAERRATSLAAGRILRHAYLARQAVAEDDAKKAKTEIGQGLKLVQIIEKARPTYTVTAEIKAGDLDYSADEVVVPPLVPIFEELGEVELLDPVAAAEKEQQPKQEDVVADVTAEHTSLSLNLALAKAGLVLARSAVDEGNLTRADEALADVQRAAVFETDALDVPIATARENLYLARIRLGQGDSEGSQEALDAASDALDDYAKLAGSEHAKDAERLRGEIAKLSSDLKSGRQTTTDTASAEKKILAWWDDVVDWWYE
jgi:hypothetical protein